LSEHLVIVAGLGEIGRPLLYILSSTFECKGIDVEPVQVDGSCSVLHVCYPFQIQDFVGTTVAYIEKYKPEVTIINSTVAPGTTREVQRRARRRVAYSPVRGKHVAMERDLMRYQKFVAGIDAKTTEQVADHFAQAGFRTAKLRSPEIAEVSKLIETTWVGILVGWAQEMERMAAQHGATYEEVNAFLREIDFVPSRVFPGHIGGHCVMPNIAILQQMFPSKFLDAVVESNQAKEQECQTASK